MGDNVIIINAKDIVLTGEKWERKAYTWHTGYAALAIQRDPA